MPVQSGCWSLFLLQDVAHGGHLLLAALWCHAFNHKSCRLMSCYYAVSDLCRSSAGVTGPAWDDTCRATSCIFQMPCALLRYMQQVGIAEQMPLQDGSLLQADTSMIQQRV